MSQTHSWIGLNLLGNGHCTVFTSICSVPSQQKRGGIVAGKCWQTGLRIAHMMIISWQEQRRLVRSRCAGQMLGYYVGLFGRGRSLLKKSAYIINNKIIQYLPSLPQPAAFAQTARGMAVRDQSRLRINLLTMQLEKMSSMEQETDVEHLSVKLKKMKKLLPKLSDTQRSFNLPSHSPRSTIWTDTATGWTRDQQPVHAIPKARRFDQTQVNEVDAYPELMGDLRQKIIKKGIKFPQSRRQELFVREETPSPNHYQCERYLDSYLATRKGNRQLATLNPQSLEHHGNHIKGGAIGRFDNHAALYDPQSERMRFNEKLINEAMEERKRSGSFKIRERRNRCIL